MHELRLSARLITLSCAGGFGNRGIEGMVLAAQYARENKVPYFGICLGMQVRAGRRAHRDASSAARARGRHDERE